LKHRGLSFFVSFVFLVQSYLSIFSIKSFDSIERRPAVFWSAREVVLVGA